MVYVAAIIWLVAHLCAGEESDDAVSDPRGGLKSYAEDLKFESRDCFDYEMPQGCNCDKDDAFTVRCTVYPRLLPRIVKRLIIQKIMTLTPGESDPDSRLVAITCRDCSIASIPSDAFRQFPNVREVDFSHGELFHISELAFRGLHNLKHIDVSFNSLTDLYTNAFLPLKHSLEQLFINNNKIDTMPLNDVQSLNQLENLRVFQFHSNSIFCSCDLFYLHQWISLNHISVDLNSYYCYQKPHFLTFQEENNFLRLNCLSHYQPIITNITASDCSTIQVRFVYEPFIYNISVRMLYMVEIASDSRRTERHEVIGKQFSISNLDPRIAYEITIGAIEEGRSVDKSDCRKFMITQYMDHTSGSIKECMTLDSTADAGVEDAHKSNLVYHTGIVSALAVCATVFIAMMAAFCVYCCRTSNASLNPINIFKPRNGFNEFNFAMNAQPALTYISATDNNALYAGNAQFCSSDALRRHIMCIPGIKIVKHENLAFNRVLKGGKFGTMYSAEAFRIKPDEYHSNVTVIEFSQRTLYERTGSKLIHFCRLSHPNILNVLGIQETLGPISLVLDHVREYLDLKTFLLKMQNRGQVPCLEDPVQILSLTVAQVVSGLSYLAHNGFIHGDISARSCIVTSNFNVKITFTGAQVDFYPDEYLRTGSRYLPVRWMSWEAIQFGSYSLQSDIWSFGVLIYEIFTYGDIPYSQMSDMEVASHVTERRASLASFSKPFICPDEIWKIAEDCWKYKPNERISAKGIENRLLQEVWNIYITETEDMTQSELEETFKSEVIRRLSESGLRLDGSGYESISDDSRSVDEDSSSEDSANGEDTTRTTTQAEVTLPRLNQLEAYV